MKSRKRNRSRLNGDSWSASGNRRRLKDSTPQSSASWPYAAVGLSLGGLLGLAIFFWPAASTGLEANKLASTSPTLTRVFTVCHTGGGTNCVVDGDTIWMDGVKIRVADIDAPETHPPRCAVEAELGGKATNRLLALVNEGPFDAQPIGNRDADRYGRKLRVLVRNGRSLGDTLVSEGLARTWDGARHPWC